MMAFGLTIPKWYNTWVLQIFFCKYLVKNIFQNIFFQFLKKIFTKNICNTQVLYHFGIVRPNAKRVKSLLTNVNKKMVFFNEGFPYWILVNLGLVKATLWSLQVSKGNLRKTELHIIERTTGFIQNCRPLSCDDLILLCI